MSYHLIKAISQRGLIEVWIEAHLSASGGLFLWYKKMSLSISSNFLVPTSAIISSSLDLVQ